MASPHTKLAVHRSDKILAQGHRSRADLSTELAAHRLGETIKIVGDLQESARPADHILGVVPVKPGLLVQDRQTIDRVSCSDCRSAYRYWRQAHIVLTIAGNIDNPPVPRKPVRLDRPHGIDHCRAQARATRYFQSRRRRNLIGKSGNRRGTVEQAPRDAGFLLLVIRPLHDRNRDAVTEQNRIDHIRITRRLRDPGNLQIVFALIDTQRNIDRQDQFQINALPVRRKGSLTNENQKQEEAETYPIAESFSRST